MAGSGPRSPTSPDSPPVRAGLAAAAKRCQQIRAIRGARPAAAQVMLASARVDHPAGCPDAGPTVRVSPDRRRRPQRHPLARPAGGGPGGDLPCAPRTRPRA